MRVMMVADFFWPLLGGVEQHVRTLSHELTRRGHDVTVVTTVMGDSPARERDGAVEVIRVRTGVQRVGGLYRQERPWSPPIADPVAARSIRRALAEVQPDVVHGHDWLARSLVRPPGKRPPLVTTLHYYTLSCAKKDLMRNGAGCAGPSARRCLPCASNHYGPVKGPLTAAAAACGSALERRATDAFIAVSTAAARGNGLTIDGDRCHVVPNFLPDDDAPPAPDLVKPYVDRLPDGEFFLYVGDLRRTKGYDVLLRAYATLGTERPLVVIGKRWPGSPAAGPPGTTILGEWPNEAVRAALGRAVATVVPSVWSEPFGIVAIEALAAGSPVIASATGGLVDIVEPGRSGLLVAPGDDAALAAAMDRIERDEALRAELAAGARARAERFRARTVVPVIEHIYATAVARAGARR